MGSVRRRGEAKSGGSEGSGPRSGLLCHQPQRERDTERQRQRIGADMGEGERQRGKIKRQGGSQDKAIETSERDGQSRTEKRHRDNQSGRCGKRKSERNRKTKEKARVGEREKRVEIEEKRQLPGAAGGDAPSTTAVPEVPWDQGPPVHGWSGQSCDAHGPALNKPVHLSSQAQASRVLHMSALAGLHSHLPAFLQALSLLLTHLTYQPQAGPALCYVGLLGEEGCGPRDCLIAFAYTVPSFPVSLLLFSWSQLQSPLLQEALPELPSLGPVPTLGSSSSWVPSFQPCLL